jgi:hypothetical protein
MLLIPESSSRKPLASEAAPAVTTNISAKKLNAGLINIKASPDCPI